MTRTLIGENYLIVGDGVHFYKFQGTVDDGRQKLQEHAGEVCGKLLEGNEKVPYLVASVEVLKETT